MDFHPVVWLASPLGCLPGNKTSVYPDQPKRQGSENPQLCVQLHVGFPPCSAT